MFFTGTAMPFDENAAGFLVYNCVLGSPWDHPMATASAPLAPRAAVLSSKIRRIFCEFRKTAFSVSDINEDITYGRIRSETARFSDDKARFSERAER